MFSDEVTFAEMVICVIGWLPLPLTFRALVKSCYSPYLYLFTIQNSQIVKDGLGSDLVGWILFKLTFASIVATALVFLWSGFFCLLPFLEFETRLSATSILAINALAGLAFTLLHFVHPYMPPKWLGSKERERAKQITRPWRPADWYLQGTPKEQFDKMVGKKGPLSDRNLYPPSDRNP